MTDHLQLWFDYLRRRHQSTLPSRIEVTGIYDKHTGPAWPRAGVRLIAEPSDTLEVIDEVENRDSLADFQHPDYIVFGLLDVLMSPSSPLLKIRIIIQEVMVDPVETNRIAFLMAGRDAGLKILEAAKRR